MSNLQRALDAYKNGELIIVTDDADRENEGDLMLLAECATPEKVAFMVRHTTGILCVALTQERARTLRLPLMVEENQDSKKTAFTVSVDYKVGLTTGVSATERANTVRALADGAVTHSDFIRPGHVFPLIADIGGLAARGGHTEAGVALSYLVGAQPVCLLSEIVNDDGSMARGAALAAFAQQHSIPVISVQEIKTVATIAPAITTSFEFEWAQLPLRTGMWSIATYPGLRQREHAVISFGDAGIAPMVRIHSECFTGDVVHSQRCDCGEQLEKSIALIQSHGLGYIIYLRDHEGRGIGLTEKIKAYQLQDAGMDTIDANLHLGHEIDARDWSDAIAIVKALGLKELTLLTNNPNKVKALRTAGIEVKQVNLTVAPNSFNEKYLATKEEKLGHSRGGK
jgi:3,4-dihydroxy 2-butanone 4-phosphate synthase / GTP cyclohydrolase II